MLMYLIAANSTAEVRLNYTDKAYLVAMNTHQLSVLQAFAHADSCSVMDLALQASLSVPSVTKCVKGFLEAGILNAHEEPLQEASVLTLNRSFTSRRLRFKIVTTALKPREEKEVDATCNTLQQDRKYYMECTIVRIMKARKVMKHSTLIEEVIKQTSSRFVPDVSFIKKNVESLIEKLYMSRTADVDEYQYLA